MKGCCVLKAKVIPDKISMFPFLGKETENFDDERQIYQKQIGAYTSAVKSMDETWSFVRSKQSKKINKDENKNCLNENMTRNLIWQKMRLSKT